jgi:hypothetical protein
MRVLPPVSFPPHSPTGGEGGAPWTRRYLGLIGKWPVDTRPLLTLTH